MILRHLTTIAMILCATAIANGQMKVREELDDKYKWNLTDLYPSDEAWMKEKARIEKEIDKVTAFKGKLTESPESLLKAMEFYSDITKEMTRLYSYVSMLSDQDTRVSKYAGMKQEISQVLSTFSAKSSYFQPELLAADEKKLLSFFEKNEKLKPYEFFVKNILKNRNHKGSEDVERVIALSGLMSGNSSSVFSTFFNADFPHAVININGEDITLNSANFSLYRASEDREIRKSVFEAYFSKLNEYQRTFGSMLSGNLNKDLYYARARNFETCLESALNAGNIPTDVFHNLIKNVNDNLDTFHRYLSLRKRMMGLDQLHYYDLYAPLVEAVDMDYTVEEGIEHILGSLKPLGKEYVDVSKVAFNERWIDMYPNAGKRSGAYSNGSAYDVHPYILMNYNGKYNDVTTLTHELGHTMHSYLTNKKQEFINSNYSIFVAEVASTLNEELLNDYMLKQINDDKARLSILGNYLEGAKGTLFRQTQFAEFEMLIHDKVEKGEALTGEVFDQIYFDLTKKYYGHDKGICIVDDYIKSEWSYIPHFYYNFYVYQYATSFTASAALSEKILHGTAQDREKYLNFLASGSTKYPVDLLIDAGVDMNSPEPFDLTIKKINDVMDEMEKILTRMGK